MRATLRRAGVVDGEELGQDPDERPGRHAVVVGDQLLSGRGANVRGA
jgi:hypothetical protein